MQTSKFTHLRGHLNFYSLPGALYMDSFDKLYPNVRFDVIINLI